MDFFGIGAAYKAMAQVYSMSARRSGRTTALLNSLKDGDRVVFASPDEANRFKWLAHQRGIEIKCEVAPVDRPEKIFEKKPNAGRTIFDHSWVEMYYKQAIDYANSDIDKFEKHLSREEETDEKRIQFNPCASTKWRI